MMPAARRCKMALPRRLPTAAISTTGTNPAMTTRTFRLCAALVLATAAAWASAQTPPIKPGLWEVKSEGHADGKKTPPAGDRLQGLSPALRAQVEASMKEKGVALGPAGVNRICFSREAMDPARWGEAASCKTEYGTRSSSSWKWRSVCAQPEMTIDGEAIFANPENYSIHTTTTMKRGEEVKTSQRRVQAHWLSADCGDLKPFDPKR
jgi:hypothetical protein